MSVTAKAKPAEKQQPGWNDRTFKIVIIQDSSTHTHLFMDESSKNYRYEHLQKSALLPEQLIAAGPDLVFLNLPRSFAQAQEICTFIKTSNSAYIPVIMIAEQDNQEEKLKGIQAGADDIILNPVNQYELKFRVRNLLHIKSLHDQLKEKINQLEHAQRRLWELADTDALTQLHNYRYFVKILETEINRSKRHQLPVSLVMLDIDLFKTYNDVLGHPAGNQILASLAKLIRNNVRRIDTAARYGGEEFGLILPVTPAKNAHIAAEKLRTLVQKHEFSGQHVQPNQCLTISCGVATFPQDGKTGEHLIHTADSRLYTAKNTGRNKVVSGDTQL